MFIPLFGDLDFDGDRPTWPPVGTRELTIEDVCEALFFSATWSITAKVDGDVFARSTPSTTTHSQPSIKRWARELIRTKYVRLRQLGVDADREYVALGGKAGDLRP